MSNVAQSLQPALFLVELIVSCVIVGMLGLNGSIMYRLMQGVAMCEA